MKNLTLYSLYKWLTSGKIISKRLILEMNVSMVKVCNHGEELVVSRCVKTTDQRVAISIHLFIEKNLGHQ